MAAPLLTSPTTVLLRAGQWLGRCGKGRSRSTPAFKPFTVDIHAHADADWRRPRACMPSEPTGVPTLDRTAQARPWKYIETASRHACTLVFGFSLCTRIIPLSVDFGAPRQSARLQESEGGSTACAPPIVALLNQEPWTHYPVCLSCTEGCFASALPYPQRYALGRRRLVSRRRTDAGPDGRCPPRADNARRGRCEARPVRSCWMDAACRGWSSPHPLPLDLWACTLMGVGSLPVYRAWPQHSVWSTISAPVYRLDVRRTDNSLVCYVLSFVTTALPLVT